MAVLSPSWATNGLSLKMMALTMLGLASAAPNALQHRQATDTFNWAVVGDSWSSGVAWNLGNVYKLTDREYCYRCKEAWGAQMEADTSWTEKPQKFEFAACGGTLMDDLKRQMRDKAGKPRVVWGMFGGNNAFFGDIARACIYQPLPGGWGPAWDEDPNGTGYCKKNLKQTEDYLATQFPDKFNGALDDIFSISQEDKNVVDRFDLYVSSYVRFFDETTTDCDNWSFGHETLSAARPKLVRGLRKVMNDNVAKANQIQGDIIKKYKLQPPNRPRYSVHHAEPDSLYQGHRFCQKGHTFEDQYYNKDVWIWNLQWYDEKSNTDQRGAVKTDPKGVKYMGFPAGFDPQQAALVTVLGAAKNPAALAPPGDPTANSQSGFGWTARPFHPKWNGHEAMKTFFIKKMKDDKIPGIKGAVVSTPAPPKEEFKCNGLGSNKYVSYGVLKDNIVNKFCKEAVNGPLSRTYNERTPEEAVITLTGPAGFKPTEDECVRRLLRTVADACDGNNPKNPENYKGGGTLKVDNAVTWEIQPRFIRSPAEGGKMGGCDSTYSFFWNEYVVWGHGWVTTDFGAALKGQVGDCALLPDTWSFDYGVGSDGREWTAKFRTGVFQRGCVSSAGKEAGAPSNYGCGGSG